MQPQPGQPIIVGQTTQYVPGQQVVTGQAVQYVAGTGMPVGGMAGFVPGHRPAQMMSFVDAVMTCIQKYFDFEGRASRSEYWFFYLSYVITNLVAIVGLLILFGISEALAVLGILGYCVLLLGFIVPMLAVTARRLHDVGYSGWWMFIAFVPFGNIVLLVFCCMEGEGQPNMYGPVPTNVLL